MLHMLWIVPLAYALSCWLALTLGSLYVRENRWAERALNWWLLPLKLLMVLVVGPLYERWLDWKGT